MSDPFRERPPARWALLGGAALVGLALVTTTAARLSEIGTTRMPPGTEVDSRTLHFADRPDGAITVHDRRGDPVAVLPPGSNGFIRGVMRGLARERMLHGIDAAPPFRLIRWADGRLSLEDTATGRLIDLAAFGPTNAQAFARLLTAPSPD